MSIWKIAWRSIQHRALSSGLTAFSMALGVALVVAVIVIHGVIDKSFRRGAQGYDLIVGAKGSPLDLVLNTVFYLGQPAQTIPYEYYREISFGRYQAEVEIAIPLALGETYRGVQVVATTPDFFEKVETSDGRKYTFQQGENMRGGDFFSAVVGYRAARRTGLKLGDKFRSSHGSAAGDEHDNEFTVVGILKPTGTPNDQVLFIHLEGFYEMHAHQKTSVLEQSLSHTDKDKNKSGNVGGTADEEEEELELDRRLSAILVITKDRVATARVGGRDIYGQDTTIEIAHERAAATPLTMSLERRIGDDLPEAHAVSPALEITKLFEQIIGNVQTVLIILAVLVIVVAGIGMMVSIYNSMNERRQEIAIMRALGASRMTVMGIILSESILLSLGGGLVGVLIGHGLIFILGPRISEYTGIVVSPWQFQLTELILIPGLIALASVVGYLPAVIAYRTDVAQSLAK